MKKNKNVNVQKTSIPAEMDFEYFQPIQVKVIGNNFDRAVKNFRSMVQSEKILSIYKEKSRYEKPSDKKRRKKSESIQRNFEEEMKMQKILSGEYEKEKMKKLQRKEQKMREKAMRSKEFSGE